ncbi:MAG: antitoxin Xre-like helix-turn-helix domain-containing protein [Acidobacteriaceae bacterium]|jgi:putative toxin-antitoxin system antitoxin component (TIGR02293 family)
MSTQPTLKDYLGIAPTSGLELAQLVEKGLPTKNLELLKARGLTFTEMANTVISPRTLKHRKARGENLTPEETERAVRVARTIALAEKVFANRDKAMRWLRHVSGRLDGRTPMSFLNTEAGARQIEGMLHGIAEGIFS